MQKLIIVKTLQQLKELADYLRRPEFEYVSYDTETSGLDKDSKIIGYSVCAEVGAEDVGYYVVLAQWDVKSQVLVWLDTVRGTPEILEILLTKKLIMANAPFDCWMTVNNFGIQLMPAVHTDVIALGHLLNENRSNGLKERGIELFGADAAEEQRIMKASVLGNGGVLTKEKYELYKADADIIAAYGAKDAILTMNVFCNDVPILFQEGLDKFFYEDETMPLLRGPTYDLNTTGLAVDPERLSKLKGELEAQIMDNEAAILRDIEGFIKNKYPGKSKKTTFNLNSNQQLAWLLFDRLENEFHMLTKAGQEMCRDLELKRPYSNQEKRDFVELIKNRKGQQWREARWDYKTRRMARPKLIQEPLKYMSVGKETMEKFSKRYRWCATLMEMARAKKLLNTYVCGIQSRMKYNIIRPSFLQHGTTSGRYSSKRPNFQNLPRDDKRVKYCIVARPGKVLVAADQAQLEPRVFASQSQDERLMACFASGEDFYSVVGAPIFDTEGRSKSLFKDAPNGFAKLFPEERQIAKEDVSLATAYGTTKYKMAASIGRTSDECEDIINRYFEAYPKVYQFMMESHEQAKSTGVVYNMFGRPRRMPKAMKIPELFGDTPHGELEYKWRNILNLAINHRVQSTGASIVNRGSILFYNKIREAGITDCYIVLQCHDELIVECKEEDAERVAPILKYSMENAAPLPGVGLLAEPKIGHNLAELK